MEKALVDSDDERPPLPSVSPPPLSPPSSPPPTPSPSPASPSPSHPDSPPAVKKILDDTFLQLKSPKKVYRLTLQKPISSNLNRSVVGTASASDPFLDFLHSSSRKPFELESSNDSKEENSELNDFSRELMNVFEELDAKIIAQQRAPDGLCLALLPKSLRQKEFSENKDTTPFSKSFEVPFTGDPSHLQTSLEPQNQSKSVSSLIPRSSLKNTAGEVLCLTMAESPGKIGRESDSYRVRDRAIPSPARKVETIGYAKYNGINQKPESMYSTTSRALSTEGSYEQDEAVSKPFIGGGYQWDDRLKNTPRREFKTEDRSNIEYMLYNRNSPVNNSGSSSSTCNSDSNSKSNSNSHKQPQDGKTKGGFYNFCNRLKLRGTANRNVYHQYVRQVFDKAPKLDGYESDSSSIIGDGGGTMKSSMNAVTCGSLCSSPTSNSDKKLTMSDGIPVNIFGTVRKSASERTSVGGVRSIQNMFNKYDTNRSSTTTTTTTLQGNGAESSGATTANYNYTNNTSKQSTTISANTKDSETTPRRNVDCSRKISVTRAGNGMEEAMEESARNGLSKRRSSFQSLWRIFNGNDSPLNEPTNRRATTSIPANVLASFNQAPFSSSRSREDWEPRTRRYDYEKMKDDGSTSNLTSSKKFVSCLEIRIGK